jgi:hypothetical protein
VAGRGAATPAAADAEVSRGRNRRGTNLKLSFMKGGNIMAYKAKDYERLIGRVGFSDAQNLRSFTEEI